MNSFDNTVKPYLSVLDNKYVSACLTIILIVYASLAAPKLPENVARLFDNPIFKLVIFFLIVYLAKYDATLAIIAAVAVLVSLMTLNKWDVNQEMMANISKDDLAANLESCNNWDCAENNDSVVEEQVKPWSDTYQPHPYEQGEYDLGNARPYLEDNPVESLHHFNHLPENEQVQEVINEKNRVEAQLRRKLSSQELKGLCTVLSNSHLSGKYANVDIGVHATAMLNNDSASSHANNASHDSEQVEAYENTDSSSYARAQ